jgi:hypothetical protein
LACGSVRLSSIAVTVRPPSLLRTCLLRTTETGP